MRTNPACVSGQVAQPLARRRENHLAASSLSDLENSTLYNSIWRVLIFGEGVSMVFSKSLSR
jgi:hypothetical protein